MRRIVGPVLVVLGALLLGLGLLAKPYLYNKLATVPLDQDSTSVSEGKSMAVLYPHVKNGAAAIDKLSNVEVKSTRTVLGIPGRVAEAGVQDTTAFWQTQVKSQAKVNGAWKDLSYSDEGVSFDRVTGTVTNCCDDYKSTGDLDNPKATKAMKRAGNYFKFPFDVQKQSYDWWDGDLEKAQPIEFKEEADLFGTNTYVFSQVIPKTEIGSRDVPASLFKADGTGNVNAKVMYGNTRTLWIEPNTGVIIKGEEKVDKTLVSSLGTVPMTVGTIGFNDATVEENAKTWGSKGSLLGLIKGPLMWYLLIPGLLLLAGGALLMMRGRSGGSDSEGRLAPAGASDDPTLLDGFGDDTTRRRRDLNT